MLKYLLVILLFAVGCNRHMPTLGNTNYNFININDSIKLKLSLAYQLDTVRNKPDFISWVDMNGGYILSFKYIEDSLTGAANNDLALLGARLAYQHGYMGRSLAFLGHFKPLNEQDSVTLWFHQFNVCGSKFNALNDDEVLAKLGRHIRCIMSDEHLYFQYLSDLGWHFHNLGNYDSALKYDQLTYDIAHGKKYSSDDIALTCQRLGNDYNDLVRKHLVKPLRRKTAYDQSESMYKECLYALNQIVPVPKEKIANCFFTYNFLIRVGGYSVDTFENFKKALNLIIPNYSSMERGDLFMCLHPTLASIILTHLAEDNFQDYLKNKSNISGDQCLRYGKDCFKLFNQIFMEPYEDGSFSDLIETYWQRNSEQLINYELSIYPKNTVLPEELFYISNSKKYPLLFKNHALSKNDHTYQNEKLETIALLNSLRFLGFNTGNKDIQQCCSRLARVKHEMEAGVNFKTPEITKAYIKRLQKKLATDDAVIIDFNLASGSLLTTIVDKTTFKSEFVSCENAPFFETIADTLKQLMQNGDVRRYSDMSSKLFEFLFKKHIDISKYKKVIVIPCQGTYLIPFSALAMENKPDATWSDLNYLGDHVAIQTVPSIQLLLQDDITPSSFHIGYMQATLPEGKILPYNNDLKDYLIKEFRADILDDGTLLPSSVKSGDILHIATHTEVDAMGYVSLLLNKSKLKSSTAKVRRCKMAVLNACETNDGRQYTNEGKISLSRLFLSNGADAVITSTGKVDNHASAELFKLFYKYVSQGYSVSVSLCIAKREIRKITPEWSNPYYWSLFELFGSDLTFSR